MSKTRTLNETELARLMMLTGALHDVAEIERTTRTHDEMITRHIASIAKGFEQILFPEGKKLKEK